MAGSPSGIAGRRPARASTNDARARARQQLDDGVRQIADAFGRRGLVESDILDRRADQQRAVGPRDGVTARSPDDARRRRAGGPGEVQELAAHRPHRQLGDALDAHAPGPAAGGDDDGVRLIPQLAGADLDVIASGHDPDGFHRA